MFLAAKYRAIKSEIEPCKLIAVSKTKPIEDILQAYEAGCRDFGENKVQEMLAKQEQLPKDIRWHLIGHLQSNKVKYIASFVHLIHSVDSLKLLQEINKQAQKSNRTIDCLMQIHIAQEESKFGLDFDEAEAILQNPQVSLLKNIKIVGLMGMASFTDKQEQIGAEFAGLKHFFEYCKEKYQTENIAFTELSMGMSGDYALAIKEGATMVRIGSTLFGARV
ncbi:MAG: YggS family pyridoxal phosphate-dependent enzyme [Raineya sp.]